MSQLVGKLSSEIAVPRDEERTPLKVTCEHIRLQGARMRFGVPHAAAATCLHQSLPRCVARAQCGRATHQTRVQHRAVVGDILCAPPVGATSVVQNARRPRQRTGAALYSFAFEPAAFRETPDCT